MQVNPRRLFHAPNDEILQRLWIHDAAKPINFRVQPTVPANLQVLMEILSMKPAKENVPQIMELVSSHMYGSSDFGLMSFAKIFSLGRHDLSKVKLVSPEDAQAEWTKNLLGPRDVFLPNSLVLNVIREIFQKKQ